MLKAIFVKELLHVPQSNCTRAGAQRNTNMLFLYVKVFYHPTHEVLKLDTTLMYLLFHYQVHLNKYLHTTLVDTSYHRVNGIELSNATVGNGNE